MTLILPGDCTLQCGMLHWNHDSEFTKWQHPAMWYVALGWHAIEFAKTSAILEFYIWFRFWPYHRSRHVILHQSAKFYPNRTTLNRKKWRNVDFQDGGSQPSWILRVQYCVISYKSSIDTTARNCLFFEKIRVFAFWRQDPSWRISAILDFMGPIMGSLKTPCRTSYRSSVDTIALNCLLFEKKSVFFAFWRQTDRRTDGQHRRTIAALAVASGGLRMTVYDMITQFSPPDSPRTRFLLPIGPTLVPRVGEPPNCENFKRDWSG